MRPIDALLLLANLLTFFVLSVPLPPAARWMHVLAPIGLLIAVAQMLAEGPRWQLVPAYALAGLFFLVWLLRNVAPAKGAAGKKRTHPLAAGLAMGLGVLGLAVSVVLPVVLPVFRFPNPSGPYRIGTVTYHWVDGSRQEVFSADLAARRELMVQIWYPAKDSSSPRAPYLQNADVVTPVLARLLHLPEFTLGHLKGVTTNARSSAAVSEEKPSYLTETWLPSIRP